MDSVTKRRARLMARYDQLRVSEQVLVQLCSVIYEPTRANFIANALRNWSAAPDELKRLDGKSLKPYLRRLQTRGLLGIDYRCDVTVVEVLTRRAVASGGFKDMARAVQKIPMPGSEPRPIPWLCYRSMRNLRIGIYRKNLNEVSNALLNVQAFCGSQGEFRNPVLSICNNPFDANWFQTLPSSLQLSVLSDMFYGAVYHFRSDREGLRYALDPSFLRSIDMAQAPTFQYGLAVRLLFGGRLDQAKEVLPDQQEPGYSAGLRAIGEFLRGDDGAAVGFFEQDLKTLRNRTRKRNRYYSGIAGVIYVLALLRIQDETSLNRAHQIVSEKRTAKQVERPLLSAYQSLQAIVHMLRYDNQKARAVLAGDVSSQDNALSHFLADLALFWLDGTLPQPEIDSLSRLFIQTRDAELDWLALEIAELLCRVEQKTPIRRNFIEHVRKTSGMHSFVASIRAEEKWQRDLRALAHCTTNDSAPGVKATEWRLVWILDPGKDRVWLQPKEQKMNARGTWTKGRKVSLKRIYEGFNLDFMSPHDLKLRAAIGSAGDYYGGYYELNMDLALPALVGHPLVFLADSPRVPVEVVKGEPEVLVNRTGSRITVELTRPMPDGGPVLVRETPTRFKVIELTEAQKRIMRILGDSGLSVPASARDEVLSAVSAIASQVTVHSEIGGVAAEVEQAEADPLPHLHLMPVGPGFTAEMFVKPLGAGGPCLKPGQGAETVIAEIDGRRMQTRRDLDAEKRMAQTVESACPVLMNLPQVGWQWMIDESNDCLQLLLDLKGLQDRNQTVVFWPEGEKLKVTRELSFDQMSLKINSKSDWFEVSGELRVDHNLVLNMKQLLDLLGAGDGRFLPLGDGQFLALTEQLRKRLKDLELFSQRRGKTLNLHPLAALAIEGLTDRVLELEADAGWKSRLRKIHEGLALTPAVPSTLKAELRDYQVEGYTWLARLATLGFGACLADDMGLGKTIQTLAVLVERAPLGPSLVVAPTSVCMNWVDEAARFAPTLRTVVFGGNGRIPMVRDVKAQDLMICSYGLLHQEAKLLASVEWGTIVLDEAQAIKNVKTKRARAAMALNGAFKVITTGTPIENHLGEFWSLFNFINPGLLGSLKKFNERFAIPIERDRDREVRGRLKQLIQPFLLRRTKSQVLEELPPRTEVTLRVEMGAKEAAFYEALRRHVLEKLARDDGPAPQKHLKILTEIMKLRRAACNPGLIVPDSDIPSSKLELFDQVISELLESGHKALVFSQFVGHLSLIRELLDRKGIDYRYIDGSTPAKVRRQEVNDFQAGRGDLFLISLRAGGLGLNLTAADYVIHMDPWWNPAVEDQASDRAHRIGQQHPVTVYRLVVRHTIEEKIVKLHQEKRDLAGSLLAGSDVSGKISAEELLHLIREEG